MGSWGKVATRGPYVTSLELSTEPSIATDLHACKCAETLDREIAEDETPGRDDRCDNRLPDRTQHKRVGDNGRDPVSDRR